MLEDRLLNDAEFVFLMTQEFCEGSAKLVLKLGDVASKQLDVFYNAHMQHNRDVSLAILRRYVSHFTKDEVHVLLPLAGSGVRGVRIIKEVPNTIVHFNDKDDLAVRAIKKHAELNEIDSQKYTISQQDASQFLLSQIKGDYIDIDPFGSPNPFLDNSIRMLSRGGIIGVTATDTAPLCGAYTLPCLRKYDARPHNGPMCQEIGLRILIRKVQLVGAQNDKALVPLFCYPKDHYMRVYFICSKSKETCDKLLSQHQYINFAKNELKYTISANNEGIFAGPLYTGPLFDTHFCDDSFFADLSDSTSEKKWVEFIKRESRYSVFGYYDIHSVAQKEGVANMPNMQKIISKVESAGFIAVRTAFNLEAIRTDMPYDEFVKILQ